MVTQSAIECYEENKACFVCLPLEEGHSGPSEKETLELSSHREKPPVCQRV